MPGLRPRARASARGIVAPLDRRDGDSAGSTTPDNEGRQVRGWTAINGALVVAISVALLVIALRPGPGGPGLEIERREPRPGIDEIRVDVGGAVQRPGVVVLEPGARVTDAIALAGGPTVDADTAPLNLAGAWSTRTACAGSVKFQTTRDNGRGCSPDLPAYAAARSAISDRQRVVKSRRCSASGTCCSPLRRTRRYCRSSSNAEQNLAADSKFPNPSIG